MINSKLSSPRHPIIELVKVKEKEKIVKAEEKNDLLHQGISNKINS